MNTQEIAKKIYNLTGPAKNVIKYENCMTRLRLQLVSKDNFSNDDLKNIPGVIGINDTAEELQIILGPGVAQEVTAEFGKLCETSATVVPNTNKPQIGDGKKLHAEIRAKNATPGKLLLRRIASIFLPLIPAFIACGLITGILGIVGKANPELTTTPVFKLLAVAGNSIFWGMNLFVGYNAAKEFKGSPILGGALAALISHPALANITFNGQTFLPGRGGVISVILVAILGAWLENKFRKVVPKMFDLFLTPLLTVLVAGTAALFVLQPIGGIISAVIGKAAAISIGSGGAFTGFILGGTFLPMVMLGIHQALTPIHAELINSTGVTILLPILAMAGGGQVGAAAAVYCKTKNQHLKQTIASALPVGIMGIGEPLIYGVTLPLGKPFIGACIGGACGGAVQAAFVVGAATIGISGLPLAATTNNIPIYLAGLLTAYAGGFIATWILGFNDPEED